MDPIAHLHRTRVDHSEADHDHGSPDHTYFGFGAHMDGTEMELSTPENDPLGWIMGGTR